MVTDFLTDETGDLLCIDGDLVIGESTQQHQKALLQASEGDFKQSPMVGVGTFTFIDDDDSSEFVRKVRSQFTKDGMNVSRALDNNGTLEIDAQYV